MGMRQGKFRQSPYFRPGKELKELINREPGQPVPPPLSK